MKPIIQKLEIVHYPQGPGGCTTESLHDPDWDTVFSFLKSMHPHETPMITLLKFTGIADSDIMMVCGGSDVYHIQIADSLAHWFQACDPDGSEETVDVWTSDQGFSCERKFTWPLNTASIIIKHYFNTGERHPDVQWQ